MTPSRTKSSGSTTVKKLVIATLCLSLLLNLVLYILNSITKDNVSDIYFALLIASLAVLYGLIFFRKGGNESAGQYSARIGFTIIVLFTLLTGLNGILNQIHEKSGIGSTGENIKTMGKASFGGFLLHLVFPTQAIFNDKQNAVKIINQTRKIVDSTSFIFTQISMEDSINKNIMDSLSKSVNSLKTLNDSSLIILHECRKAIDSLLAQSLIYGIQNLSHININKYVPGMDAQIQRQLQEQQQLQRQKQELLLQQQLIIQPQQQQLLQQQLHDLVQETKQRQMQWQPNRI